MLHEKKPAVKQAKALAEVTDSSSGLRRAKAPALSRTPRPRRQEGQHATWGTAGDTYLEAWTYMFSSSIFENLPRFMQAT